MLALPEIDMMTALVFAGSGIAFGSCGVALAVGALDRTRARFGRRLGRVGVLSAQATAAEIAASIRRREKSARGEQMDQWLRDRLPKRELLQARLARTGRNISLSQYVAACVAVAVAVGTIAFLLGMPWPIATLIGLVGGGLLPHMWVDIVTGKRTRKFLSQFPEAIDQIVRGVRSGLPVGEAIAGIARELSDPVAAEFQAVVDSIKLGRTLEEALWRTGIKLGIPEFNFLVITMIVQKETGGNLAETLENLSDIIRRRHQMQQKARAMSSEARASALIVGSLPFILGAILVLINPEYIGKLIHDPRGPFLLGIGLGSEVMGFLVMIRMAKFEI